MVTALYGAGTLGLLKKVDRHNILPQGLNPGRCFGTLRHD
jgi:hypothetical protein